MANHSITSLKINNLRPHAYMSALAVLTLLAQSPILARESCQRTCFKQTLCNIEDKLDQLTECATYKITQEQLPFTAEYPGIYTVCSDLYWAPTPDAKTAITVSSGNVIVNFDQYTLKQTDPTQANCIGVLVNPNLTNVQLLNGTIENVSMWGIVALGGTQELLFDNISTLSCGYNGIDVYVGQSSGGLVIVSKDFSGNPAAAPQNIIIRNCNMNSNYSNLTSNYTALKGAWISGASNLLIQNSNFNNNMSNSEASTSNKTIALGLSSCANGIIQNCNFNNNIGFGNADCTVLDFKGSSNILIQNCQVLDTQSFGSLNETVGFYFAPTTDFAIENCVVANISAAGTSAFAYVFEGSNGTVRNCVAQNMSVAAGASAGLVGFAAEAMDQIVLEDCVVQNITSPLVSAYLFGFGTTNALIKNCQAVDVTTVGNVPALGSSFGFGVTSNSRGTGHALPNSNIVFENCLAQNVTAPNLPEEYQVLFASGFFADTTSGLEIRNCTSQANGIGYSLNIAPTTELAAIHSTISNNLATNNSYAGFVDNTITSSNLFIHNTAYLNNDQNYVGVAGNTPIRTWDFTDGNNPPAANNFSIATSEAVDNWDIN